MGRWSNHPMGSDGALDAQDELLGDLRQSYADVNKDIFELGKDEYMRVHKEYLEGLTSDDLKALTLRSSCLSADRFVIPFTFISYEAESKDPEIRKFLLESLDYRNDLENSYYSDESQIEFVEMFKKDFDKYMDFDIELPGDIGLFAAIAEHTENGGVGLVNKTGK